MRFMIILKSDAKTEAGATPNEQVFTDMHAYNQELINAGAMLAGEGLHPSSKGARVRFSGKDRTVIDGPFAEAKELVAGFWIIQAKSREEAIEWVKKIPNTEGGDFEVEVRQVFESTDFELSPELIEAFNDQTAQVNAAAAKSK